MNNQVSIKVQIGKREYKTLVSKEEEKFVKEAARKLNERLQEYEARYENTDMRDLLAMTALYFATEASKGNNSDKFSDTDLAKLDEANSLLGKFISSL
ncbi:MAG: cell division protein ZapA [Bacteroidia bacterium]|nr:cell division protein ZapA [Bacteroidia bacterium]MCZ2276680.1 cell division protein ZapA [Bacteroidia bacterium]